jgi:hypothetical protein
MWLQVVLSDVTDQAIQYVFSISAAALAAALSAGRLAETDLQERT